MGARYLCRVSQGRSGREALVSDLGGKFSRSADDRGVMRAQQKIEVGARSLNYRAGVGWPASALRFLGQRQRSFVFRKHGGAVLRSVLNAWHGQGWPKLTAPAGLVPPPVAPLLADLTIRR